MSGIFTLARNQCALDAPNPIAKWVCQEYFRRELERVRALLRSGVGACDGALRHSGQSISFSA